MRLSRPYTSDELIAMARDARRESARVVAMSRASRIAVRHALRVAPQGAWWRTTAADRRRAWP